MDHYGNVQPPTQSSGGPGIVDRSIATEPLASDPSRHSIRFGCLSHTKGGADTAKVWTTCTVTPNQIQFQGWISHFATSEADYQHNYACNARRIHDITNHEGNLETFKRALITFAYRREHPKADKERSNEELDNFAAGKVAGILRELCAKSSIPNSVKVTRFTTSHPQFTTVAGSVRGMTKEEMKNYTEHYAENGREIERIKKEMAASDGKEILERQPVWINPDGTVYSIRDASHPHLVAKAKLADKELDHRKKVKAASQARFRKKRQDGDSANTVHSPTASEQISSFMADEQSQLNPTASFNGMLPQKAPHGNLDDLNGLDRNPKQNLRKRQKDRSRRANSSGKASRGRGLSPFSGANSFPNSEVSQDKSAVSWTDESFADFLKGPQSVSRTLSPGRSHDSPSSSFSNWSQNQNDLVNPHTLPSLAVDQRPFSQYLQATSRDMQHFNTDMSPHDQLYLSQASTHQPHPQHIHQHGANSPYQYWPVSLDPGDNYHASFANPGFNPLPSEHSHYASTLDPNPPGDGFTALTPQTPAVNDSGGTWLSQSNPYQGPYGSVVNNQTQTNNQPPIADGKKSFDQWMKEAPNMYIPGISRFREEGAMGNQGQHQNYNQPNSNPPFPNKK